jgi:segregation and condensation protein B
MSEERNKQDLTGAAGGPTVDGGAVEPTADDVETDAADELTAAVATRIAADEEIDDANADEDADDADALDADEEEPAVVIFDADAEDRAAELAALAAEVHAPSAEDEVAPASGPRSMAELMAIIEALVFVSEDPLPAKTIAELLAEERGWVEMALEELTKEFNERNGGLLLREVAGGWQIATRPEYHEHVRAFLKSRPSAKLSLAALETLAVIAYKQPITIPEIMEIRGVQSTSAIKTLLDKRLIIAKGRKETIGRPMMYGTSKEFLLQFGLKDLTELPNVEDFEDLAGGSG